MHYLNEHNIFLFLVQVSILLGLARALGELLRKWKQPSITGEILVGVILGPTILGRYLPSVHNLIFPPDVIQQTMLETVAWFGLLFFLLKTGLEIDFTITWRQRGDALRISIADLIIPMIIAFIPSYFLPVTFMGEAGDRFLFALFIATIMTISALPVTARILNDLNIYKTDIGFLIMSALTINDIIGWIVFTLILGFFTDANVTLGNIIAIISFTFLFTLISLTKGVGFANMVFSKIKKYKLPEPSSSLTFISILGMIYGAITLKIGIHALFGFFIAGIMIGEAKTLPEKTRHTISNMVHAIFVPLFFTNIGLKIDFFKKFNIFFVLFVIVIGISGRYLGAWLGVFFTKQAKFNRSIIALAHIPGGEMQIVVGILALEYRLITEEVYVAIVFGAILSSIIVGPWMGYLLKKRKDIKIIEYFLQNTFISDLRAQNKDQAIHEISLILTKQVSALQHDEIEKAVRTRENLCGTAIDNGIAIPHSRFEKMYSPIITYARSLTGIEWNSPDGKLIHHIFFILSPEHDDGIQLQILKTITEHALDSNFVKKLSQAKDRDKIWEILNDSFSFDEKSMDN